MGASVTPGASGSRIISLKRDVSLDHHWTGLNGGKHFFDPFASIEKDLRNGTARGRIPYEDRKQKYATEGFSGRVPARKIYHSDYTVIKEVVVQNWDRRLAGLSAKFQGLPSRLDASPVCISKPGCFYHSTSAGTSIYLYNISHVYT